MAEKKFPRSLQHVFDSVTIINGQIAKWKRDKYAGKVPEDIISSIVELHVSSSTFLEIIGKNEDRKTNQRESGGDHSTPSP